MKNLKQFSVTVFASHTRHRSEDTKTWDELVNRAENPATTDKHKTNVICSHNLTTKTQQEIIDHNKMGLLWVDIDTTNESIDSLKANLSALWGGAALIYSTASSMRLNKQGTINGKRWRVLIPMEYEISCNKWIQLQRYLISYFNGDTCGDRLQQILYAPTNPDIVSGETRHYEYSIQEGEFFTPDVFEKAIAGRAPRQDPKPDYDNNVIDQFNATADLPSLIVQAGYERLGSSDKYRYLNGESGSYGGVVFDDRVFYTHHTSDRALCDGYSHNAFSIWLIVEGISFTEGLKRLSGKPVNTAKPKTFSFAQISLNGQSKQMEQDMLNDVYILILMALLGQHTVFYAGPNTGKTLIILWMLVAAIKNKNFEPENLIYINADDTHKGLTQKLHIAESNCFYMACPGYKDFTVHTVVQMMQHMAQNDQAKNKIIVLDTLKKFTSLMDKEQGSAFGNVCREFTSKGGSIISLAHVNKHKIEGKSVHAGTSDISDDADCVYIGDLVSTSDSMKVVEFTNTKSRGNVEEKVSFSYKTDPADYTDLFESVKQLSDVDIPALKESAGRETLESEYGGVIEFIKKVIYEGDMSQAKIIDRVKAEQGISRRVILQILKAFTNHEWVYKKYEHNIYKYRLIDALNG